MKIAIISDTHDNLATAEKALKWIKRQEISLLIHCGDLCAPTFLTQFLVKKFPGEIHLVYGNVGDRRLLQERAKSFSKVKFYGDAGRLKIGGKRIGFTHRPEEAQKMAKTGRFDIVFYGHTHKPWEDRLKIKPSGLKILNKNKKLKVKSVCLVNPGTLAGMFYKATFAIYDPETDKLELKIVEKL